MATAEPTANGATFSPSNKKCYAEFGMTGQTESAVYRTCRFSGAIYRCAYLSARMSITVCSTPASLISTTLVSRGVIVSIFLRSELCHWPVTKAMVCGARAFPHNTPRLPPLPPPPPPPHARTHARHACTACIQGTARHSTARHGTAHTHTHARACTCNLTCVGRALNKLVVLCRAS